MKVYKLRAYLKHLTLSGYTDGEYEWIGTSKQWSAVQDEINNYEETHYA